MINWSRFWSYFGHRFYVCIQLCAASSAWRLWCSSQLSSIQTFAHALTPIPDYFFKSHIKFTYSFVMVLGSPVQRKLLSDSNSCQWEANIIDPSMPFYTVPPNLYSNNGAFADVQLSTSVYTWNNLGTMPWFVGVRQSFARILKHRQGRFGRYPVRTGGLRPSGLRITISPHPRFSLFSCQDHRIELDMCATLTIKSLIWFFHISQETDFLACITTMYGMRTIPTLRP